MLTFSKQFKFSVSIYLNLIRELNVLHFDKVCLKKLGKFLSVVFLKWWKTIS